MKTSLMKRIFDHNRGKRARAVFTAGAFRRCRYQQRCMLPLPVPQGGKRGDGWGEGLVYAVKSFFGLPLSLAPLPLSLGDSAAEADISLYSFGGEGWGEEAHKRLTAVAASAQSPA